MTTVVSPGGSETSYFNRSGVAILDLRSGASTTSGSPTTITKYAGTTVVLASMDVTDDEQTYYQIGSDFDVGDVIEFYNLSNSSNSPGGQVNLADEGGNALPTPSRGSCVILRKVSSTGITVTGYASGNATTWFACEGANVA